MRRQGWRWLLVALFGLAGLVGVTPIAHAAAGDSYDRWDVAYVVSPNGSVHVTETITLRFGPSSGRHGFERYLIVREKYDDTQDALYQVSNVNVSSPSSVSTNVLQTSTLQGRTGVLKLRIGDASRVIYTETATYVISYDVAGGLRTFPTYDEFYWDVTGSSLPLITSSTVTATVPGGAKAAGCSVAIPGSQGPCAAAVGADGVATFKAGPIPAGQLLTISTQIGSGLISNARPILVESATLAADREAQLSLQRNTAAGTGASVTAALIPLFGWLYWRRNSSDRRFAGLPPGVIPSPGEHVKEVEDRPAAVVPVAFSAPTITFAEAGYLLNRSHSVRDTTATLVDLAVKGVVQLKGAEGEAMARATDLAQPDTAPGRLLLAEAFIGYDWFPLGERGTLVAADQSIDSWVQSQSRQQGWFATRAPGSFLGIIVVSFVLVALTGGAMLSSLGASPLWVVIPGAAMIVTLYALNRLLATPRRTGIGRALTDQVEGFRLYLTTAEADQLRFEESEDIFSRYLPWAVLFDCTQRWTDVCQQAVDLGLMQLAAPTWYDDWTPGWTYHDLSLGVDHVQWDMSSGVIPAPPPPPLPEPDPVPDVDKDAGWGGGSGWGGDSGGSSWSSGGGSAWSSGGGSSGGGSSSSFGGFSGGGGGGGGGDSW